MKVFDITVDGITKPLRLISRAHCEPNEPGAYDALDQLKNAERDSLSNMIGSLLTCPIGNEDYFDQEFCPRLFEFDFQNEENPIANEAVSQYVRVSIRLRGDEILSVSYNEVDLELERFCANAKKEAEVKAAAQGPHRLFIELLTNDDHISVGEWAEIEFDEKYVSDLESLHATAVANQFDEVVKSGSPANWDGVNAEAALWSADSWKPCSQKIVVTDDGAVFFRARAGDVVVETRALQIAQLREALSRPAGELLAHTGNDYNDFVEMIRYELERRIQSTTAIVDGLNLAGGRPGTQDFRPD